ncbi:hypothetical protein P389DRAFT_102532 [Cystobasidium minutum MCA 4210]|uniref:uncharacterized protein n=1 Tax=Cystobasidium minutum MCA 4210 TaxID=1397322 RepID=UPI0034CF9708|eukprot:jgi/Rhomi1/102532/CE102531_243
MWTARLQTLQRSCFIQSLLSSLLHHLPPGKFPIRTKSEHHCTMHFHATLLSLCLAAGYSKGLLTRQTGSSSTQVIDLDGPQVRYEGPWLNITSPCELGETAKRTDNSLAEDAKATITFGADVKAFTISVQTQTASTNYLIETADKTYNYDSDDDVKSEAGETGCPTLLTHNFGTGSRIVNVTLRMPRSAKRDALFARQAFKLPGIQLNRVEGFLNEVNNGGKTDDGNGGSTNGTAP